MLGTRIWFCRSSAGAALALAAWAACGDDSEPAKVAEVNAISLEATAAGRLVVAEVNGKPIYGECVRRQAEAFGLDRRAALEDCIDFELLAQEADRKRHAGHPEVRETMKREAVRALLAEEFEPSFDSPEDVPESVVTAYWSKHKADYNFEEHRFARHLLVEVDKGTKLGAAQDRAAKQLADDLYAELAGTRWSADEFVAEARRLRASRTLARMSRDLAAATRDSRRPELAEVIDLLARYTVRPRINVDKRRYPFPAGGLPRVVPRFAKAAFAIPEEGMVSKPARTRYGWHVILLEKILLEQRDTYEDAAPKIRELLFARERHLAFERWLDRFAADAKIVADESWLPRMVAAEREQNPLMQPEKSP